MPEAAPLEVSSIGSRYSLGRSGSVVDSLGVGGIGRTKTLIRAMSPAVR